MIKLTVIMPVFNTEKYLIKAIDSIQQSSFNKFIEIIVVDDCSTGNCKEIIQNYSNIKYIRHKKNLGVFSARFTGIQAATGEYITHLDPDDFVKETIYEKAYLYAKETDADVVMYNFENIDENNTTWIDSHCVINRFHRKTGQNILEEILLTNTNRWPIQLLWNKIVKTDIMKKSLKALNRNYHINLSDDLLFSISLYITLYKSPSIHAIKDIGITYLNHSKSITKDNHYISIFKKLNDLMTVYEVISSLFKKVNLYIVYKNNILQTKIYMIKSALKKIPLKYKIIYGFKLIHVYWSILQTNKSKLDNIVLIQSAEKIISKLINNNIQSIVIYGDGKLAQIICNKLSTHKINIKGVLTNEPTKKNNLEQIPIYTIDDIQKETIIIASIGSFYIIKERLENLFKNNPNIDIIGIFD